MKITKLGHCCLLINHKGLNILTDPGEYSVNEISNLNTVDLVLITHDHADHLHIESLKGIIKNNPEVKIITNSEVGAQLDSVNIVYQIVEDGESLEIDLENGEKMIIEAFGNEHALVYVDLALAQNTGFFVDNILFYPGDAFTNPGKKVDILALPVAGPWLKIGESINYALEIKPRVCFPVHEAGLKEFGTSHNLPSKILPEKGIQFIELDGKGEVEMNQTIPEKTALEQDNTDEEGTMGI